MLTRGGFGCSPLTVGTPLSEHFLVRGVLQPLSSTACICQQSRKILLRSPGPRSSAGKGAAANGKNKGTNQVRKQFQEPSGNVAKGQWCLVVMLGELGMGLGSVAGRGALSQPRADVVHTVCKAAFASWVCGPCHPVLQCGVALVVVESPVLATWGLKTLSSGALSLHRVLSMCACHSAIM